MKDGVSWSGAGKMLGFNIDRLPPGSMNVMRSNQRILSSIPICL
jgi:hypothetical protein